MKKTVIIVMAALIALLSACGLLLPDTPEQATSEDNSGKRVIIDSAAPATESPATAAPATEPPATAAPATEPPVTFKDPGAWNADYRREYSHPSGDLTVIGTDEEFSFRIQAETPGLGEDDFIMTYDAGLLSCKVVNIDPDHNGKTLIEYSMRQIAPGQSEIRVRSSYEYAVQGENCACRVFPIRGLDRENGRTVYYAPEHGKRYHFDAECPGENSTPTTLYDALAYGLTPCKKCAQ